MSPFGFSAGRNLIAKDYHTVEIAVTKKHEQVCSIMSIPGLSASCLRGSCLYCVISLCLYVILVLMINLS